MSKNSNISDQYRKGTIDYEVKIDLNKRNQ